MKFSHLLSLILLVLCFSCAPKSYNTYKEECFQNLEKILNERKTQLIHYLTETGKLAQAAKSDELLTSFFVAKKKYYYTTKNNTCNANCSALIQELKNNIQQHYLLNYQNFYDILFIDNNGEIFYTIRKQADYHKNIFNDNLAETNLSQKLKKQPGESFVDFQFYEISNEPSAFFIEPIIQNNKREGWIVLQCALNNINNLFIPHKDLGYTGEVFLVNKEHFMITNSRFSANPTNLSLQLSPTNINAKFKEQKGRKTVIDYRNKKAISSFEVFRFFDKEWLIIAKIDEDEIVSQYFEENEIEQQKILPAIHESCEKIQPIKFTPPTIGKHVDMDEFMRCDTLSTIYTKGVFTCTAIVVSYPGKFSYLAHISPYDLAYNEDRTDLLNQLFKQINYFEITESEKQYLEFQIISTQSTAFKNIINSILSKGYFLSQIKIMQKENAMYGDVYNTNKTNSTVVQWNISEDMNNYVTYTFNDIPTIDELIFNSN